MRMKLAAWSFVMSSALGMTVSPAFADTVTLDCPDGTSAHITKIVQEITADGDWKTTITYTCLPL